MTSITRSYSASVPGQSTHHRRTSSKAQHASPSSTSATRQQYDDDGGASKDKGRARSSGPGHFTFPAKEAFTSSTGSSARMGISTPTERLNPILEDGRTSPTKLRSSGGPLNDEDEGVVTSTGTPPKQRITPVKHRLSPSLPYPPYSGAPPTPSSSMQRVSLPRILYSNLRRARWLDLVYGTVFVTCLFLFISSLAGVGAPSNATSPTPLTPPSPGLTALPLRPPPPRDPLIIKDETDDTPVFARGRPLPPSRPPPPPPSPRRAPSPIDADEEDEDRLIAAAAPLPREARPIYAGHEVHPMVPQDGAGGNGLHDEHDAADDLVGDSPSDIHLDDAHAAHYHHPPEGNLFRPAVVGDDEDEGAMGDGHRHDHDHGEGMGVHREVPAGGPGQAGGAILGHGGDDEEDEDEGWVLVDQAARGVINEDDYARPDSFGAPAAPSYEQDEGVDGETVQPLMPRTSDEDDGEEEDEDEQ